MSKRVLDLLENANADQFVRLFNRFGKWIIPFNRPHKLKILELDDSHCLSVIPYRKTNWNHLKGIHAGAIATIGEFAAGVLIIWNFGIKRYRIILSKLDVEYHYQGKTNLNATSTFDPKKKEEYQKQLDAGEPIVIEMTTELHDEKENKIATINTAWQLKSWESVKTKI